MKLISLSVVLLSLTVGNIQSSSLGTSKHRAVRFERHKRFQVNSCTFSQFNNFCKFTCKDVGNYIVCLTAKLNNVLNIPDVADVEIQGTVNGLMVYFERLNRESDPNPEPKCSLNICMVLYNVVPEKLSACLQLKDQKTNTTIEVGCFGTTLFGEATAKVTPGEATSPITTAGRVTSSRTDSGTGSTKNSGTSCITKRSGSGQECTTGSGDVSTTSDGQDVNGSDRIGIPLSILLLTLTILKLV